MPPHGPAQRGEAALPRSHVRGHLAKVVEAELGGGSHLQEALIPLHFTTFSFPGWISLH